MLGFPSKLLFGIALLSVLMQSRSLPLYLETQNMLENSASLFNQAYLYCNNFDSTETGWNAVGSAPYLNDDSTSYIQSYRMSNESWFGFSDATDLPQQIFLEVEARGGAPASYCTIFLGEGTASYVVATVCFDRFTSWKSYNVTSQLNSVEKLQAAKVKFQSLNDTTSFGSEIYRCRLRLYTGPVPIYSTLGTNTTEANASASFHCQWTDIDGLSTASLTHNCTGSFSTVNASITDGWGNFSVTLPTNSLNNVVFWFWANDTSNNWERTDNQTLKIVWTSYNVTAYNKIGDGQTLAHSLGRKILFDSITNRYWMMYYNYNGTVYNLVWSSSPDGKAWSYGGILRENTTQPGAGWTYWQLEQRSLVSYCHIQFGNERVNSGLYYRRGLLSSNGSINLGSWQTVVSCPANHRLAYEGIAISPSGHVWMGYEVGPNGDYDSGYINITMSNATDGTWTTHPSYPQQFYDCVGAIAEAQVYCTTDYSCHIVYTPSSNASVKNNVQSRLIIGNVLQAATNASDTPILEARFFSCAMDAYGNLHLVYKNYSNHINYCKYNTTTWNVRDKKLGYSSYPASYPVIGTHVSANETYVNWISEGNCYISFLNGTTGLWQNSRIHMLDGQKEAADPNVVIEQAYEYVVFAFEVYNWTSGAQEIWSIAYKAASSSYHLIGDINNDGMVDVFDCVRVALAFGSHPSDPNWDSQSDINEDAVVDIFDIVIVAVHYGEVN